MRPFLAIGAVTVALCALIAGGGLLIGVEGQWAYGLYRGNILPRYGVLQIPIVAATILALIVWAGMRRIEAARRAERVAWVAALVVTGFLNLLGLVLVSRAGAAEPGYLHYVDWSGGYFNDAIRLRNEADVIRRYPEFLDRLSEHGRSHPPGTMMVNLWALRFFDRHQEWGDAINRAALQAGADLTTLPRNFGRATPVPLPADWEQGACHFVAWSILAFGVTVAVPVYLLGATLMDRPTGLAAAGMALVVPSLGFFEPLMDLTYPVFTTWGLWFMARGFAACRWGWWAACGFVLGLALFLSYNQWAALPVVGLWILAEARRRRSWSVVLTASAAVAGGLLVSSLAQGLVLEYNPVSDFFVRQPWRVAKWTEWVGLPMEGFDRPYHVWIFADLLEFFTFVGIPVTIGLVWAATSRHALPFTLAVIGGILFLDLTGVTRSEVARMWMFLMPAAVTAASSRIARSAGGAVLMVALMAFQSLLFKLFLTTNNIIS